tara:strand:- start:2201 stop:2674 length:474 start_codon:yes stop_codon:yes gene_type:complete
LAEEPLFEPEPYPDFLELAQEHQLVDLDYFGGLFLTLEDRTLKIAIACAFEVSLLRMGDVVLRTKTPTLSHHMEKYGFAISPNDSKWDTYSGPMLGRGQREKMLVEVPWEMKHGDELFISHFLHSKTPRTTHPTWRLRCVSTLEVDALRQECEEVLY